MHKEAEAALKTLGHPEINVRRECGKLGVGQQQMVEIAKAVSLDAKLIIMDEPTSSLGKDEIAQLMETVRSLKARGVAILFVSHKLEELFELCERVTVMLCPPNFYNSERGFSPSLPARSRQAK